MVPSPPAAPGHVLTDRSDLREVRLPLDPNEASGIALVTDAALLERLAWSLGFWVCLDDGPVERCVALVGHPAASRNPRDWAIERLHGDVQEAAGSTEDCEAIAVWDGWVHLFGSQFGAKDGPLQRKRQFVARFREADVELRGERIEVAMQLWEAEFALHRLINDALRLAGVDLLPLGPATREAFLRRTRRKAVKKGRPWRHRIREDDVMVNVEGAAFLGDGTLLLGLRQPVTGDGHPLVVAVDGLPAAFEGDPDGVAISAVWTLEPIGSRAEHLGVRDLSAYGETVDVLVGNVEALGEGSVFLDEHPEGGSAVSSHWRVDLSGVRGGGVVHPEPVRGFDDLRRVEGMAQSPSGSWYYVSDEDAHVQLHCSLHDPDLGQPEDVD